MSAQNSIISVKNSAYSLEYPLKKNIIIPQQENIPKNTEYSRDLLKNIMQKTFETSAISRTIADPSIIKRLVNEYAHDPEFENVYGNPADLFTLKNKLPYREKKLCIPRRQFRLNLLHNINTTLSTGHLGKTKIRQRIQPYYYWKELRKSVQHYVKCCRIYRQTKTRNRKPYGLLQRIDPLDTKWTTITMDFIAPVPKTRQHNV